MSELTRELGAIQPQECPPQQSLLEAIQNENCRAQVLAHVAAKDDWMKAKAAQQWRNQLLLLAKLYKMDAKAVVRVMLACLDAKPTQAVEDKPAKVKGQKKVAGSVGVGGCEDCPKGSAVSVVVQHGYAPRIRGGVPVPKPTKTIPAKPEPAKKWKDAQDVQEHFGTKTAMVAYIQGKGWEGAPHPNTSEAKVAAFIYEHEKTLTV